MGSVKGTEAKRRIIPDHPKEAEKTMNILTTIGLSIEQQEKLPVSLA